MLARLLAFRDLGPRKRRDQARLMYMIEEMGMEKFRQTVVEYAKGVDAAFEPELAAPAPKEAYTRGDIVGVHPQKQEGKSWVCVTTPAGRLMAKDVSEWAIVVDRSPGLVCAAQGFVGWGGAEGRSRCLSFVLLCLFSVFRAFGIGVCL